MPKLWIVLAVVAIHLGCAASLHRKEPTISECAAKGGECDESKGRPVCGTDNQTYPTRCHLIRAQCSGHMVSLKHRGSCKECMESRSYVLQRSDPTPNRFVPRCRADGSYAAVQCMDGMGCWCSDQLGHPINNTTTRLGRPNCPKKSNTRRSSPHNPNPRPRRGCSRADQAVFNTNLIRVFHSEHSRLSLLGQLPGGRPAHHAAAAAAASSMTDKAIVDWKFDMLDTSRNQLMERQEFRELKRLVRKAVKPKRCARTFGKFCDDDNDDRLSQSEWTNCLSRDGVNHEPSHQQAAPGTVPFTHPLSSSSSSSSSSLSSPSSLSSSSMPASGGTNSMGGGVVGVGDGGGGGGDGGKLDPLDEYEEEEDVFYDDESGEVMNGGLSGLPLYGKPAMTYEPAILREITHPLPTDVQPAQDIETPETGCVADRATALDDQHSRTDYVYVPECTLDGRYQRVQCYKSAGYCWCVNEDTGKNIAGTSVKDRRPDCSVNTTRPMKGCPEPKKLEFLRELRDFLRVYTAKNATIGVNQTKMSEDEKVGTLIFVLLDKNKNSVWERKEWKLFRELVTTSRTLRKCGRKMPRYCDVNNDNKVTLAEWLICLQTKPTTNALGYPRPQSQTSKLRGPNPMEHILKE